MADETRPPKTERSDASGPVPAGDAKPQSAGELVSWHKLAGIGFEFIAAFGVFALLGWWLDKKFGTAPWLLITGCGIGFTGGLWNMIKAARKMM